MDRILAELAELRPLRALLEELTETATPDATIRVDEFLRWGATNSEREAALTASGLEERFAACLDMTTTTISGRRTTSPCDLSR